MWCTAGYEKPGQTPGNVFPNPNARAPWSQGVNDNILETFSTSLSEGITSCSEKKIRIHIETSENILNEI